MGTPADRQPPDGRELVVATRGGTPFGRTPLWRVGSEALSTQLRRMRDSIAIVCEESGVEDIHQMRVATRRLRTVAHLLEATPAFRRKRLARLRDQLQPLARDLGVVRDLDIMLAHLDEYERTVIGVSQTSSAIRDELLWRREKALTRLRRALQRPATRKLLPHPRKTAKRLVARKRSSRRTLVRHVAGDALWKRYEAVLSFEDIVTDFATAEQLHALRIACKQLRYTLELFTEDSDPCAQSLIATLKEVQDHLGELQDCVYAVTLLTHLRHDYPRNPLLEGFRAAQEARRNALRQEFAPLWEHVSEATYRQNLAALIAAL